MLTCKKDHSTHTHTRAATNSHVNVQVVSEREMNVMRMHMFFVFDSAFFCLLCVVFVSHRILFFVVHYLPTGTQIHTHTHTKKGIEKSNTYVAYASKHTCMHASISWKRYINAFISFGIAVFVVDWISSLLLLVYTWNGHHWFAIQESRVWCVCFPLFRSTFLDILMANVGARGQTKRELFISKIEHSTYGLKWISCSFCLCVRSAFLNLFLLRSHCVCVCVLCMPKRMSYLKIFMHVCSVFCTGITGVFLRPNEKKDEMRWEQAKTERSHIADP